MNSLISLCSGSGCLDQSAVAAGDKRAVKIIGEQLKELGIFALARRMGTATRFTLAKGFGRANQKYKSCGSFYWEK